MEPANANLHHHHHQLQYQQLLGSSSSPSPSLSSSCYGVSTQNPINLNPGTLISQTATNDFLDPSLTSSSSAQDLGLFTISQPNNDLYLARNKGEIHMGSHYYQKFSEMMQSSSPSSCVEDFRLKPTTYLKNNDLNDDHSDQKVFLRSLSSSSSSRGVQIPADREFYPAAAAACRGSFSQILPTINISKLQQSSSGCSGSLGMMDLQGLNLLASGGGRFPGHETSGLFSYGLDHHHHMQQQSQLPPNSTSNNMSTFIGGVGEANSKRSSSVLEHQKVTHPAPKKTRPDSRASCPPFKVRKEKLGDRIAALQQLVAPFGKTDTASVLMEAIGYIKFLQDQVETLSVPYMKSSRNKSSRTTRGASTEGGGEEPRRDLRSRGLCLVPVSCLSYVTEDGGGLWPPS